jgi:hypothetical protein
MFNSLLYIFSNSRVIKKKLSSLFVLASCLLLTSCADINGAAEMVSFTVLAVIMLPFTIILAPVLFIENLFHTGSNITKSADEDYIQISAGANQGHIKSLMGEPLYLYECPESEYQVYEYSLNDLDDNVLMFFDQNGEAVFFSKVQSGRFSCAAKIVS